MELNNAGVIEHDNIFYVRNINTIGGVETYVYELAKKYQNNDIAVVCKTIAPKQKERLKKFCKVYIHTNQKIKCKVIITNWDTSIISYVNDEAKVYTVLHTDYSHYTQGAVPLDDKRITYIAITEASKKTFEKITGITDRIILCRNPLEIEKIEKPLILMSATRLTKEKGGHRMLKLANELDLLGVNYLWFVFSTNEYKNNPVWQNENIIKMDNRLDLDYFYNLADWYIQFSEVEGDSYSLKEALYRGIPIAVCELPYFKEYGIEDGKNALFLEQDCRNIKEVAKKILKPPKFVFEQIQDGYDKIVVKGKSKYKEEMEMKVKVKAIIDFNDLEEGVKRKVGNEWVCSLERANFLIEHNAVEAFVEKIEAPEIAVEEIEEDNPLEAKVEIKKDKKKKSKK